MSQPKNKIIIELWGAPGVGKTTFAEELVKDFGYTRILPRIEGLKHWSILAKYPLTIFCWLIIIFLNFIKIKDVSIFRYNVSLLFSAVQRIDDARRSPDSKVVLDEGLVQRFLSYSDTVHKDFLIKCLMAISPVGNIIILVNDREVDSDRYEDNDHLRNKLGTDYVSKWRTNLVKNIDRIYGVSKTLKKPIFFSTKEDKKDGIIGKIID